MEDAERMAREERECGARNAASSPPAGAHCRGTYDTWLCWPHTPANGTAFVRCPAFVPGFSADLFAHKRCEPDGTWFQHPETGLAWSNYTSCVPAEEDAADIIAVYEAGYGASLAALLLSLAILLYFRSLRCARITVHMNLFLSFALNNAAWLAWYSLVVRAPAVTAASPAWCRALAAALQYCMLSTYTWMLCEGAYLHTVLVHAFVSERRLVRALLALGWLPPAAAAGVYAARRAADGDGLCWSQEEGARAELATLAAIAVLLNAAFLCNIVRVLCSKLRRGAGGAGPAPPSATALHALRATCLLAPLLGVQYLLMFVRPARAAGRWWLAYEYGAALATSLQGLCVAVLYCFCNGEVLAQLRRRWRVLTFRPRANSATATTVSFVRSGAGGGCGEDKV